MNYTFEYDVYWRQWVFGYLFSRAARTHFICLGPLTLLIEKELL